MQDRVDESMERMVSVRVARIDRDALSILAQRRRTTKSTVIRQLIAEEARRVGVMPEPAGVDAMPGHA